MVVLIGRLHKVPRGTAITVRREVKAELYVSLDRHADVRHGEGQVIRELDRGDVVGEMGMLRQRPRSADVGATEDLEYLVLDGRFPRRLRRQYPRIASTVFLNLMRILSDRLGSTTDALTAAPHAADSTAAARTWVATTSRSRGWRPPA